MARSRDGNPAVCGAFRLRCPPAPAERKGPENDIRVAHNVSTVADYLSERELG